MSNSLKFGGDVDAIIGNGVLAKSFYLGTELIWKSLEWVIDMVILTEKEADVKHYEFIFPDETNGVDLLTGAGSTLGHEDFSAKFELNNMSTATDVDILTTYDAPLANGDNIVIVKADNTVVEYNNINGVTTVEAGTGKILTPQMTGYTSPSGEASASGHYSANYAWKAFDRIDTTEPNTWRVLTSTNAWLQYRFDEAIKITRVNIKNQSIGSTSAVRDFRIEGSNNGSDWDILHEDIDLPQTKENIIDFANTEEYTYYRVFVIRNYGANNIYIAELEFLQPETIYTYPLSPPIGEIPTRAFSLESKPSISVNGNYVDAEMKEAAYTFVPSAGTNFEEFLDDGIYTGQAGITEVTVKSIGGGGKGNTKNLGSSYNKGGGGRAGASVEETISITEGEQIAVVIGIGAKHIGQTTSTPTSFGAYVVANGGGNGSYSASGTSAPIDPSYAGLGAEVTNIFGTFHDGRKMQPAARHQACGGQAGRGDGGDGYYNAAGITPEPNSGAGGGGYCGDTGDKAGEGASGYLAVTFYQPDRLFVSARYEKVISETASLTVSPKIKINTKGDKMIELRGSIVK